MTQNHCLCLGMHAHMACGLSMPVTDLSWAPLLSVGFLLCKSTRVYHFSLPHCHHWDRCICRDRECTTIVIKWCVTPVLEGFSHIKKAWTSGWQIFPLLGDFCSTGGHYIQDLRRNRHPNIYINLKRGDNISAHLRKSMDWSVEWVHWSSGRLFK